MSRLENLKIAMVKFAIDPDDYDEDVEEDLRPYIEKNGDIGMWAPITHHEGKFFIYPCYPDWRSAEMRLEEYAADDIYAEVPVGLLNLDNGAFYPVVGVRVIMSGLPAWNLSEVTV